MRKQYHRAPLYSIGDRFLHILMNDDGSDMCEVIDVVVAVRQLSDGSVFYDVEVVSDRGRTWRTTVQEERLLNPYRLTPYTLR